jgi:endonuclease/exonuclease/phosphatase family metal-dependent hydrolase
MKRTFPALLAGLLIIACTFLPAPAAHAQTDTTLRIATWNVEWLNDADPTNDRSTIGPDQAAPNQQEYQERLQTLTDAIEVMDPDILALQEVESAEVVRDLADLLQVQYGLEYEVAFVQGRDTYTGQDVAFLVERGLLLPDSERRFDFTPLREDNNYKDLSKHLRIDVQVNGEIYTLVTLHLISSNSNDRLRQARTLRAWTEDMAAQSNLIVLGDFNAGQRFNQTTPDSEMGIIRGFETPSQADDLFDVHMRLGQRTTHVGDEELDRILLSQPLVDSLIEVETRPELAIRGDEDRGSGVDYALPRSEQDLSDHFPLVVQLALEEAAPAAATRVPTATPMPETPAAPTPTATVAPEPAGPVADELQALLEELERIEAEIRRLTEEVEQIRLLLEELVE